MAVQDAQERANLLELSAGTDARNSCWFIATSGETPWAPQGNLLNPVWREWLRKALWPGILSWSSWTTFLPFVRNRGELQKRMDPVNQWLLDMRFNGISTLMLHHTNKEGTQRGLLAGRTCRYFNSPEPPQRFMHPRTGPGLSSSSPSLGLSTGTFP